MSAEEIYDEIARLVQERGRGGSCRNPRYFASMLAGTMSANGLNEQIAAEELLAATRRIIDRTEAAWLAS